MKLSLVIPCYNEEKNIPLILSACANAIKRSDVEVVLVNNGSTDGSAQLLNELQRQYSFLRIVTVAANQGYGFGIISGLKAASGQYIGWTHGDMQTPPSDAIKALDLIEQRGDPIDIYVKGRRRGRPLFDRFFTIGMAVFESVYLRCWMVDINAQPNIFHRSFFESWQNPPYDFSLDLYAFYLARRQMLDIERIKVDFLSRQHGKSHWNTDWRAKWRFIKRTLTFSITLKKALFDLK